MVNWLSTEKVPKVSVPYSWRLKGSATELSDEQVKTIHSDGYKVVAEMGWVDIPIEDLDYPVVIGACVEGLDSQGVQLEEGSPVICTLIDYDGQHQHNKYSVTTIPTALWNKGAATEFKSYNRGDAVLDAEWDSSKLFDKSGKKQDHVDDRAIKLKVDEVEDDITKEEPENEDGDGEEEEERRL